MSCVGCPLSLWFHSDWVSSVACEEEILVLVMNKSDKDSPIVFSQSHNNLINSSSLLWQL